MLSIEWRVLKYLIFHISKTPHPLAQALRTKCSVQSKDTIFMAEVTSTKPSLNSDSRLNSSAKSPVNSKGAILDNKEDNTNTNTLAEKPKPANASPAAKSANSGALPPSANPTPTSATPATKAPEPQPAQNAEPAHDPSPPKSTSQKGLPQRPSNGTLKKTAPPAGTNSGAPAPSGTSPGQTARRSSKALPTAPMTTTAKKEEVRAPPVDKTDQIIQKLLAVRNKQGKQVLVLLKEDEIKYIHTKTREILMSQPTLLELDGPIKVAGDIHGQYYDLLRLFDRGGFPPDANYLFLGDYVDRGKHSMEVICLLFCYKMKYPENFFLLRGNHESAAINRMYGFYDDCKRRYNVKLWKGFTDVFNCLPAAATIGEKILCMHGGISPDLSDLRHIRDITRPTEVPDQGLLCDLLWADPEFDIEVCGQEEREREGEIGSLCTVRCNPVLMLCDNSNVINLR